MPRSISIHQTGATPKSRIFAAGLLLLTMLAGSISSAAAEPPAAESAPSATSPDSGERIPISRSSRPGRRSLGAEGTGSAGWWFGSAGIALALAVCGGLCVAARKYLPQASSPMLRVVGRVSLSPKHSVYLLRAGGRVILVGAGPQGAPSYLGELTDSDADSGDGTGFIPASEPLPFSARVTVPAWTNRAGSGARGSRLDVRLGDEQ